MAEKPVFAFATKTFCGGKIDGRQDEQNRRRAEHIYRKLAGKLVSNKTPAAVRFAAVKRPAAKTSKS